MILSIRRRNHLIKTSCIGLLLIQQTTSLHVFKYFCLEMPNSAISLQGKYLETNGAFLTAKPIIGFAVLNYQHTATFVTFPCLLYYISK